MIFPIRFKTTPLNPIQKSKNFPLNSHKSNPYSPKPPHLRNPNPVIVIISLASNSIKQAGFIYQSRLSLVLYAIQFKIRISHDSLLKRKKAFTVCAISQKGTVVPLHLKCTFNFSLRFFQNIV